MNRRSYMAALYIMLGCNTVFAQRASEQDLLHSALASAFHAGNPERITSQIERAKKSVESRFVSARDKQEMVSATLVFSNGISAAEAATFVEKNGLEILRIEVKNAIGEHGRIATISIGNAELLNIGGSLEDRIKVSIGTQQFRLGQLVSMRTDEDSQLLAETAFSPALKIFTLDIIGPLARINSFLEDRSISAVILDDDDTKIRDQALKRELLRSQRNASFTPIIRRLEDGPPPGVDPARVIWRAPPSDLLEIHRVDN